MTNRTHEVLTEHQSGPGGEVPPLCPARFLFKVRRLFFPHRAFRDVNATLILDHSDTEKVYH